MPFLKCLRMELLDIYYLGHYGSFLFLDTAVTDTEDAACYGTADHYYEEDYTADAYVRGVLPNWTDL